MISSMMKKRLFLLIGLLLCSLSQFAQTQKTSNYMIKGRICASAEKGGVSDATIIVKNAKTAKTAVANSDSAGYFSMHLNSSGVYSLTVTHLSYKNYSLRQVFLTSQKPTVDIGTVYLSSASSQTLQEVVIVSSAPVVSNQVDKIVYNVANDATLQGGVALDVLKKVPQVNVDVDGNVELQGSSSVRFLINGKPSSVFGNSLTDALASIPASEIKSIEAITTPGAKYDAQGTGGIINIVLKDNKMRGINGNINLSAGTRLENGSVNFNVRRDNFGFNAFFNGNAQLRSKTPFRQNRTSWDTQAQSTTQLLQSGYTNFIRNGYQGGLGADWSPTKNDNFTASFSYNHIANQNSGIAQQDQYTQDLNGKTLSSISNFRNSDSRMHQGSYDWSLDYTHKFKRDGQTLDILYDASSAMPFSSYFQSQTYKNATMPYTGTSSSSPGTNRQTDLSADYTQPLGNNFILETGLKTIFHDIGSNADVNTLNAAQNQYLPDPTQSYSLKYHMRIYAGYVSGTFSLFHYLDVKAGFRYEFTHLAIDYPNTTIPSYGTIVPSLIFSHKFDSKQTIKLAFTRRIERPDYGILNPFMNLSDPYNITVGNPLLKPEIGTNFELGYSRTFDNGGNIYVALMERLNRQDIKSYTTFYPSYQVGDSIYNNVSLTQRVNAGSEDNTGIILTSSLPFGSFNIRENAMIFYRHMNYKPLVVNGFFWRLNLNASYQFPKDLLLEAFGDYRPEFKNIQGKVGEQLTYTFAFRKQFDHKNASIGITATNPFTNYVNQVTTIQTNNYNSYYLRQVPYRSFGISFTYKFGELDFKKNKSQEDYLNNVPDMGN